VNYFAITRPNGSVMLWQGGPLQPADSVTVWLTDASGKPVWHVPRDRVKSLTLDEARKLAKQQ